MRKICNRVVFSMMMGLTIFCVCANAAHFRRSLDTGRIEISSLGDGKWEVLNPRVISESQELKKELEQFLSQEYIPGQWGFSSDHLPVNSRIVIGEQSLPIVSFNVLNENYKKYIKQGQGLDGSELDKMSVQERDQANLDLITTHIKKGVAIFALQECSPAFIGALEKQLDLNKYDIRKAEKSPGVDYGVVIFDKSQLSEVSGPNVGVQNYISENEKKARSNYIHTLRFQHVQSGFQFYFVNTHATFGLTHQLRDYLVRLEGPVVALGDMNVGYYDPQPQTDIHKELLNGLDGYRLIGSPFEFSHVNTFKRLDLFDHIVFKGIEVVSDFAFTRELRQDFSLKNRK